MPRTSISKLGTHPRLTRLSPKQLRKIKDTLAVSDVDSDSEYHAFEIRSYDITRETTCLGIPCKHDLKKETYYKPCPDEWSSVVATYYFGPQPPLLTPDQLGSKFNSVWHDTDAGLVKLVNEDGRWETMKPQPKIRLVADPFSHCLIGALEKNDIGGINDRTTKKRFTFADLKKKAEGS